MTNTAEHSTALVGYVRCSTTEQQQSGLGLDAQRAAIELAAMQRGRELVAIYQDAESGASMTNRVGLADVLAEVSAGRAGGLIVSKLDRLSRSLLDFANVMERSRREGWALIALDLGVDTSSPQGQLLANVLAAFAEYERQIIRARTRDALAIKRDQGATLGRPRSIPDETIALIEQLRADGMTWRAVAARLNAEGVPTARGGRRWTAQGLHKAFKSRN
jgi:DNA invertase Pin-like site-specific DNA recombinase